MTYPLSAPTRNRRNLPYHTDREMLELEARANLHAGLLPSNQNGDMVDGAGGGLHSPEQDMLAWTAQQPWAHVDCPVMHVCVLCGREVDPDLLRRHPSECLVALELSRRY